MATINQHADISIPLALEFEGRAKDAGMTAEKFLKTLLNNATQVGVATTALQQAIQSDVLDGITDKVISERHGCTVHYVIQVRNKLGLEPN